ncbi:universal stress protein [Gordonia sp. NPDC003585]|uniref:universal stress protein n=1 Tax=Gordonia sp. NPDC003585 TaxID=3154275 RepID=UPI0033A2AA73
MRLLVAYLATPGGADALALGARLARSFGAELDIAMVLPPDRVAPAPPGDFEAVLSDRASRWLADAAAQVDDDVTVTTHVAFAESSGAGIIEIAERIGASAIVVGGGGGGLIGTHSLGTVVNGLLHSSPLPLVVAPRGAYRAGISRIREITCAIGDRPGADELLDTATRFCAAAKVGLRLISLVAVEPVSGAVRDDESSLEAARAHARSLVDDARSRLPAEVPVSAEVVEGRHIEDAVHKLDWHDGDLIMVGSSRLAQPRRLFLGSTAAKMMRVLQVPMIVVPRGER